MRLFAWASGMALVLGLGLGWYAFLFNPLDIIYKTGLVMAGSGILGGSIALRFIDWGPSHTDFDATGYDGLDKDWPVP